MGYLLTFFALALVVVIAIAVLPLLSGKARDASGRGQEDDHAPTTRSNLDGPQEEKIADEARPSKQQGSSDD